MTRRNRKGQFTKKREPQATWLGKIMLGGMLLTFLSVISHDIYTEATRPIIYTAEAYVVENIEQPKEVKIKVEYSKETIEQKIRDTFPETPNTMLAVAKCESGLNPTAVGPTYDYGLLQVHAPTWHEKAIKLGYTEYKTDVDQNLSMSRHIYDTQGIQAWVCYTKGYYKKYL